MIKRVKAKDIDPVTMRWAHSASHAVGVTSEEIKHVGRAVGLRDFDSLQIELDSGATRICAPNQMIRVEMVEAEPVPTATTITIEVPGYPWNEILCAALFKIANNQYYPSPVTDAVRQALGLPIEVPE